MKTLIKIIFLLICIETVLLDLPYSTVAISPITTNQMLSYNVGNMQLKDKINLINNNDSVPKINTAEDLQKYLKNSHLFEEEGLAIVSKFLIADDYALKKLGALFDLTGVDALSNAEIKYPPGTKERLLQRAKSAAKIFFRNSYNDDSYEAIGAEDLTKFDGAWRIYKVLLSGKNGITNHLFLKVCLPLNDFLPPIVSNFNDDCVNKIQYIEEAKIKNLPYLEKLKNSNVFRKSALSLAVSEEKIKKNNYSNLMQNFNNYLQTQNSIPVPPNTSDLTNNPSNNSIGGIINNDSNKSQLNVLNRVNQNGKTMTSLNSNPSRIDRAESEKKDVIDDIINVNNKASDTPKTEEKPIFPAKSLDRQMSGVNNPSFNANLHINNNVNRMNPSMQNLIQNNNIDNNPNINNFLVNQAQLMNNPLVAQQMALHEQKKISNLRGPSITINGNKSENTNQATLNSTISSPNSIQTLSHSQPNIGQTAAAQNPAQSAQNIPHKNDPISQIIMKMNFLENQLRIALFQNEALKNNFLAIKMNTEENFKKLQDAINVLSNKLNNKS